MESTDSEVVLDYLLGEIVRRYVDDDDVLQSLGRRVGRRFVESVTRDAPRFKDELDAMKFVCKDFWTAVYKKQIDNLRTNHHGVYVLHETSFRFLAPLGPHDTTVAAKVAAFAGGTVEGALAALGYHSSVNVDLTASLQPACRFQVSIARPPPPPAQVENSSTTS